MRRGRKRSGVEGVLGHAWIDNDTRSSLCNPQSFLAELDSGYSVGASLNFFLTFSLRRVRLSPDVAFHFGASCCICSGFELIIHMPLYRLFQILAQVRPVFPLLESVRKCKTCVVIYFGTSLVSYSHEEMHCLASAITGSQPNKVHLFFRLRHFSILLPPIFVPLLSSLVLPCRSAKDDRTGVSHNAVWNPGRQSFPFWQQRRIPRSIPR